jgi:hypothetical protein
MATPNLWGQSKKKKIFIPTESPLQFFLHQLIISPLLHHDSYHMHSCPSLCFNWAPRHEGVLGSGGIALCILDLGTKWRLVVSAMPQPLYPQGMSPWYPLDKRLSGSQSQSGCSGEEKNSQPLPGPKPHHPACSPALYQWATLAPRKSLINFKFCMS